jgi:hypothetical protein
VAVLLNTQGAMLMEPVLRDTARSGLAVRTALRPDQVPVQLTLGPLHELQKALRPQMRAAAAEGEARREALRSAA